MPYLYHLTTEENAKSILKNGLIPKIGEREASLSAKQKNAYTFAEEKICYCSETLTETSIPAERIQKSRVSRTQKYCVTICTREEMDGAPCVTGMSQTGRKEKNVSDCMTF